MGSTIHFTSPPSSPSSSPRTPSPRPAAATSARTFSSAARSASDTGVRSGFVSTWRSSAPNRASVSASAASASSCANSRSPFTAGLSGHPEIHEPDGDRAAEQKAEEDEQPPAPQHVLAGELLLGQGLVHLHHRVHGHRDEEKREIEEGEVEELHGGAALQRAAQLHCERE